MLTLQLINQDPEEVIRRLAVKQFDGREPIMRIVELDKQRRALQKQRDDNAAVLNKMAAQIGALTVTRPRMSRLKWHRSRQPTRRLTTT